MLGNRNFKIKELDNSIEITNLTDEYFNNCFIQLTDIFYTDIISQICNFEPFETKTLPININSFSNETKEENYWLKIYHQHKLIYQKVLNDKSKCYVLFSNKKFESIAEQLIIGLDRWSNEKIFHYSINYDSNLDYTNLTNCRLDIEGDMDDPQFMQFLKPDVFLDILNKGYQNVVFIDADVQVNSRIDNVFNLITLVGDGPIFQKGSWDYAFVGGKYIPGTLLSDFLDLPKQQKYPYFITNIVIFNQSHRQLFIEWNKLCKSKEVDIIRKTEFLHDELILNCLMWKKSIKPKQAYFFVNVRNLEDVQFFYNHNITSYERFIDMNKFNKGHFAQSFIPYNKEEVVGFHCVKDVDVAESINKFIKDQESAEFSELIIDFYKNIKKSNRVLNEKWSEVKILNHFITGAHVEVKSELNKNFKIEFWNGKNQLEYSTTIGSNMWTKTNKKYFEEYTCKVYDGDKLIWDKKYDATGKRVFITLESKSIGDTLAWFPYVNEFRKKWNCQVICSTFWNHLFVETYPEIEFVNPGTPVHNIYAMYSIGWFYNDDGTVKSDRNPVDFKESPLGKTAADILGLDFKFVKAKLPPQNVEKKKRIGIAIHSTAQTKYWNNPTGWQVVTDYFIKLGYEVMILSKENDDYMGNKHPIGATKLPAGSFEKLMETMATCEMFIGIGSGLSWLAWSLNIPTALISGFSHPNSEFLGDDVIRIFNSSVCNSCYNRYRLDAGDWNWCPDHKGTPRQFECTKSITGEMVIDEIKKKGWV